MNATLFAATALTLLAAPAAPAAQDESSLALEYFHPENIPAARLVAFIDELFESGLAGEPIDYAAPALFELGGSVLVAASNEHMRYVLKLIERTDSEYTPARRGGQKIQKVQPVTAREYRVGHVTLEAVSESLGPFQREVLVVDEESGDAYHAPNLAFVRERNTVVLRDTAESVEKMLAVLASIDVPQPQILLTYYLLQGREGGSDPGVPAELVRDLARLVPQKAFGLVSFGMLRSSVLAPMHVRDSVEGGTFHLALQPEAFDESAGTLGLRECHFELKRFLDNVPTEHTFDTRASIGVDEYTVLGGVGAPPYYLVLRLQRL